MSSCGPKPTTRDHSRCPARPIRVGRRRARCPHCGTAGEIVEVDVAYRWNYSQIEVRKGRITGLWWGLGDGDFHHERYQCAACYGPITIPNSDDIPQDWS